LQNRPEQEDSVVVAFYVILLTSKGHVIFFQ
jgi:hypothetical protein